MKVESICETCGTSFMTTVYPPPSNRRGRFCSPQCRGKGSVKHGHANHDSFSKTYSTWVNMVGRCTRPYHSKYPRYGGAGVTLCEEWLTFQNFLNDMGVRPVGKTLDRIDGTLGYFKENCRWSDITEQQRNTRSNVMVEFNGQTKCISEWAEDLGLEKSNLAWRLRNGWPVEKAFTTKPRLGNRIRQASQKDKPDAPTPGV